MERNIDMKEISDGKLYGNHDLVKVGCRDCKGCHLCCTGMGQSIQLDPYDCFQLGKYLGRNMSTMLERELELNLVDGMILPNLKLSKEEEACVFLNEEYRCSIHGARPGFCRIFPLGRLYREDGFDYFLQIHECPMPEKTKVKVRNWVGIPSIGQYEKFVWDWHQLIRTTGEANALLEEQQAKELMMSCLKLFYLREDTGEDFYTQFYDAREQFMNIKKKVMGAYD